MGGKNTKDVIWLTSVRIMTILIGIIGTRLLSDFFSYEEYGTYSQLNLLVDIFTSSSILGMTDGVNYYFSKARENGEYSYVSSIFGLQLVIGLSDAMILLLLSGNWAELMNNPALKQYIVLIALRPLLSNFLAMLTVINIAVGNSRIIAIRNGLFSIFKLAGIIVAITLGNSIAVILLVFMSFDFISIILFAHMYNRSRARFKISFDIKLWRDILKFCLPIGAYILVNSLFRSADKFIVSILGVVQDVSVYANGSAQLPFDIVWTSVQTIVIPIITFNITKKDYENAFYNFCTCMRVNIIFTIPVVICAFVLSPELVTFLYGSKYILSVSIFRVYIITELFKYLGITVILTSTGHGKYMLKISIIMLGINCILDVALFHIVGLVGPAISTVCVTTAMVFIILKKSMVILSKNVSNFVKQIDLNGYFEAIAFITLFTIGLKRILLHMGMQGLLIILAVSGSFSALVILMNRKRIKEAMHYFNEMK